MAIAEVQGDPIRASAFSGTTAPTLAYAGAVTSGNWLICVILLGPSTTVSSVTDSVNGAWTQCVVRDGTEGNLYIYRFQGTGAGTPTVTVNLSTSSEGGSMSLMEFSGSGTLTMGTTTSATGATGVTNPGNLTTTIDSAVLISGHVSTAGDQTAGSSYTLLNPANGWGFETFQYRIVSSTGTYSTAFGTDHGAPWDGAAIWIGDDTTPPTVALTGTVTASIDEADIVAGGKTVILTVTDDTWVVDTIVTPVIQAADCTVSGNNTAQATWAVSHPNASTGDLLIFYIAWDDSTTTTDVTEPAGPNSEVLSEINATPVTDSSTETRAKAWYTIATSSWTAGTITFTPSATESWSATCIRVPTGEFDSSTPIGAVGTSADTTGTDTTVDSPAFSAGSTDGDGALVWCAGVDTDPLSSTPPTGWAILQTQDLGAVAHGVALRDTEVTDSESIASATWSIAGDSWTSIAFVVRAPTTTPFENARSAIATGLDSAQSESGGWDAKVKPNIPVGNVVRTSDTVVTITLQAQADYDITAQETITATVPAAALQGAASVVASPTFTIDTDGGGGPAASPNFQTLLGVGP